MIIHLNFFKCLHFEPAVLGIYNKKLIRHVCQDYEHSEQQDGIINTCNRKDRFSYINSGILVY